MEERVDNKVWGSELSAARVWWVFVARIEEESKDGSRVGDWEADEGMVLILRPMCTASGSTGTGPLGDDDGTLEAKRDVGWVLEIRRWSGIVEGGGGEESMSRASSDGKVGGRGFSASVRAGT